jgi:DNA mismatch repair protein MutS
LKRRYPDAILFFRLGDFYETFDADAELTARLLQITLTSREMGKGLRVPMAGVPFHAAETYIARLIAAGQRVAICEQLNADGTPATAVGTPPPDQGRSGSADQVKHANTGGAGTKGMMERDVVRVVTPGTVVESRMLDAQRNNYLCALVAAYEPTGLPKYGLAYADLTTGEFATTELRGDEASSELARELDRLQPAECIVPGTGGLGPGDPGMRGRGGAGFSRDGMADASPKVSPEETALAGRTVTPLDPWRFELETAQEAICHLFGVTGLAGYGCAHLPLAIRAAGALVAYVQQTHGQLLALLDGLRTYEPGAYVRLDGFTRRNLELVEERGDHRRTEGPRPSLVGVLDETRTAMGGRLLRRWLGQPLLDLPALRQRHDAVSLLATDGVLRARIRATLDRIADVERLGNRVRQGIAQPRDLLALRASLLAAAELRQLAPGTSETSTIDRLVAGVDPCEGVAELIERAVYDASPGDGGKRRLGSWEEERLICPGYDNELDELVRSSADARQWIAGLEAAERERTGIRSLKVGFNKVFGYYLHISHAYKGEVPAHYIRRQTLTDGERYITPELKEYENMVLHAAERIAELERQLFGQVQRTIAADAERLLATAGALGELDVLASFAEVAVRRGYVRPDLDDGDTIEIAAGRHPVVEVALEMATTQEPAGYVPNDCRLSASGEQIVILTGPNMAGKSTYLRSVALIVLMAQAGSFVPATTARIGLVDRIFTRVGAQDDLTAGQSTFMVEMVEAATILRHATPRSLVILDEIGRGTSTYDGVAIARAVVEYLHGALTTDGRRPTTDARPPLPEGDAARLPETDGSSLAGTDAGPRTLFATHYHELAELEHTLGRVRNYRMDVLEEGDRVVFLHRVVPGNADRSYGIHVARLAGVPRQVTARAHEVLEMLEASQATLALGARGPVERSDSNASAEISTVPAPAVSTNGRASHASVPAAPVSAPPDHPAEAVQLSLFGGEHPLLEELRHIDVLTLTPLEAINRLAQLVDRARKEISAPGPQATA